MGRIQTLAAAIPGAQPVLLDVTDEASVKAAFQQVRKTSSGLDILVNNAGIMEPAMVATTRVSSLKSMLSTNVTGTFLCAQMAARLMTARKGGSIINIASIMGTQGASGFSAYSATKAAIVGMTRAMAKELAPLQIRVNALAPGFIETDLVAGMQGASRDKALAAIGMGQFGKVEDVTAAVLFLASPAASYITGQIIGIDGSMQT